MMVQFGIFAGAQDGAGGIGQVMLAQRIADGVALGCQERIGHAAADHDGIGDAGEIAEEIELG